MEGNGSSHLSFKRHSGFVVGQSQSSASKGRYSKNAAPWFSANVQHSAQGNVCINSLHVSWKRRTFLHSEIRIKLKINRQCQESSTLNSALQQHTTIIQFNDLKDERMFKPQRPAHALRALAASSSRCMFTEHSANRAIFQPG